MLGGLSECWGGGRGGCPPENVLDSRCSEIDSEAILEC